MKAGYEKPLIVFEEYALDTAIAACDTQVSLGPAAPSYTACSDYPEVVAAAAYTSFYDNTVNGGSCTCYYSSGGGTLLAS